MARLLFAALLIAGLTLVGCSGSQPDEKATQETDQNKTSFDRGDYGAAMDELRPKAEAGDADAQARLGFMYTHGQGVAPDTTEGARWYEMAAEQGHPEAQYNLGLNYELGRGTEQDIIQAHVWFTLAAAQGYNAAREMRDDTAQRMTADEITRARQNAAQRQKKH